MKKIILLFFISLNSIAQTVRKTTDEEQAWLAYFNQTRLSERWGVWGDFHFRSTHNFIGEPSKGIIRIGAMYYINNDLKFTNGYAYINHFPEDSHANISQPEHRIWHQLQIHNKYGKVRSMQWVRLEERFRRQIKNNSELADGFRFDERIRYNFFLNIPLSKKGIAPKTISLLFNNEVMINLSKNNIYNVFDQNRLFVGFAYNFTNHSSLQLGYMNIYQQLSAGDKFKNMNAIRMFFMQNLDFSKKKK